MVSSRRVESCGNHQKDEREKNARHFCKRTFALVLGPYPSHLNPNMPVGFTGGESLFSCFENVGTGGSPGLTPIQHEGRGERLEPTKHFKSYLNTRIRCESSRFIFRGTGLKN